MIKHSILRLILCCVLPLASFGNAAPPGFWDVGHGTTLVPLFKNDTAALRQVQMQKELIFIDLYKHYAVVKGSYWFYNHSSTTQKIRTGYPINGKYWVKNEDQVTFKDLYHLRVESNGMVIPHYKLEDYPDTTWQQEFSSPQILESVGNWYVWDMQFPPGMATRVDVYFIVQTPASLTQGYGRKEANAFEYIVQTGAAWTGRIMDGKIIVSLRDGLSVDQILGVRPVGRTAYAQNQLLYSISNLKPAPEDDLILWYEGSSDTSIAMLVPAELYTRINQTDTSILQLTNLTKMEKADFDTPAPEWTYWLIAIFILGLLGCVGLIYLIILLIKKIAKRF